MSTDQAYVYIMANSRRTLYIGVTTRLAARVREHKEAIDPIQLIVTANPRWQDLSLEWGKAITPFDESMLRPPQTF